MVRIDTVNEVGLIMVDCNLGDESGLKLLKELRSICEANPTREKPKFVAMSEQSKAEFQQTNEWRKHDDLYEQKPLTAHSLWQLLSKLNLLF